MNNNFNRNQKLLRQIILTSYLASLSIILTKVFYTFGNQTTTFTTIPGLNIFRTHTDFLVYVRFLPLIVMSFYVPWYLSCMGASLAEAIGFYLMPKTQSFGFEPVANLSCVIGFALLPGLLLQQKDHFLKFYLVITFVSGLYQVCNWYNVLKYRLKIDLFKKTTWQAKTPMKTILIEILKADLFIRLSLVFVTSFFVVILLKELFKRLQFLADTYEFDKK
ncbi:MAG: hypothetical protein ACQBVK_00320 [Candidatus Phytoplasma sp. TWB_XP]